MLIFLVVGCIVLNWVVLIWILFLRIDKIVVCYFYKRIISLFCVILNVERLIFSESVVYLKDKKMFYKFVLLIIEWYDFDFVGDMVFIYSFCGIIL